MVTCSEGQYSLYGTGVCTTCKAGTYCPSTTLGMRVLLYGIYLVFYVLFFLSVFVYVYVELLIYLTSVENVISISKQNRFMQFLC